MSQGPGRAQCDRTPKIILGLGANLPGPWGTPRQTLRTALVRLADAGVITTACSRVWQSRPIPVSAQPWYLNAVVAVRTAWAPDALLTVLHRLETAAGRRRGVANAARTLDLDILAYGDRVVTEAPRLIIPHPRLAERAFVLLPWREVDPAWHHPISGLTLAAMIAALPEDQALAPLDDDPDC